MVKSDQAGDEPSIFYICFSNLQLLSEKPSIRTLALFQQFPDILSTRWSIGGNSNRKLRVRVSMSFLLNEVSSLFWIKFSQVTVAVKHNKLVTSYLNLLSIVWLAFEIAQVKFKLKHDNTSNTRDV